MVTAATDSIWGGEGCLNYSSQNRGAQREWRGILPEKHWQPARHVRVLGPATGRGGVNTGPRGVGLGSCEWGQAVAGRLLGGVREPAWCDLETVRM